MSAGAFEIGKYEDENGNVYEVRVQPETKGLTLNSVANAYPTDDAAPDLPTLAISQSRRGFGVKVRTVTVEMTAAPTGAVADYLGLGSRLTVPVFDPATYASYGKGQTGTYLGTAVKYVGKNPEIIR
jgi:hypothetical protein